MNKMMAAILVCVLLLSGLPGTARAADGPVAANVGVAKLLLRAAESIAAGLVANCLWDLAGCKERVVEPVVDFFERDAQKREEGIREAEAEGMDCYGGWVCVNNRERQMNE